MRKFWLAAGALLLLVMSLPIVHEAGRQAKAARMEARRAKEETTVRMEARWGRISIQVKCAQNAARALDFIEAGRRFNEAWVEAFYLHPRHRRQVRALIRADLEKIIRESRSPVMVRWADTLRDE